MSAQHPGYTVPGKADAIAADPPGASGAPTVARVPEGSATAAADDVHATSHGISAGSDPPGALPDVRQDGIVCAQLGRWLTASIPAPNEPARTLAQGVTAYVMLVVISLLLLALGSQINGGNLAVTRYFARAQAPISGLDYDPAARSRILVVLYDSQFLAANRSPWPLTYGEHADWLDRLVPDDKNLPAGILVDITFGQARVDRTLNELGQTLCRIRNQHKVPIFLAGIPSPTTGQLQVRADLQAIRDRQVSRDRPRDPCFELVGASISLDPIDRLVWSYPVATYLHNQEWQAQPPNDRARPAFRSAALALATAVTRAPGTDPRDPTRVPAVNADKLGPAPPAMAMVWGSMPAEPLTANNAYIGSGDAGRHVPDGEWRHCTLTPSVVSMWVPGFLQRLAGRTPPPRPCPYHQTLSMADVGSMDPAQLAAIVRDRYVLVGAAIPGYNDLIETPVHGTLPGIYQHAMALDNLMTYGDQYRLDESWSLLPSAHLWVPGLVVICIVFAIHQLWRWGRIGLAAWVKKRVGGAPANGHHLTGRRVWAYLLTGDPGTLPTSVCDRVAHSLVKVLGWVVRILLQAAIAAVMIRMLQEHYRIGMLPIAELVGMTLVAEGLQHVHRFAGMLRGDPAPGGKQ